MGHFAADWIFWLAFIAWGGLGASLGPAIILSLFWKRTTKWGAIAGMITGTMATITWKPTSVLSSIVYELVPAFILSFLFTILFSLLTHLKGGAFDNPEISSCE